VTTRRSRCFPSLAAHAVARLLRLSHFFLTPFLLQISHGTSQGLQSYSSSNFSPTVPPLRLLLEPSLQSEPGVSLAVVQSLPRGRLWPLGLVSTLLDPVVAKTYHLFTSTALAVFPELPALPLIKQYLGQATFETPPKLPSVFVRLIPLLASRPIIAADTVLIFASRLHTSPSSTLKPRLVDDSHRSLPFSFARPLLFWLHSTIYGTTL
jgi:hypothetical protein